MFLKKKVQYPGIEQGPSQYNSSLDQTFPLSQVTLLNILIYSAQATEFLIFDSF